MHTILVVDDEQSIRDSLSGILEDEGYRTLTAASGDEALLRLTEERAEIILLDIWMPGMDGLETLAKIREGYPDQLVLMMSGHGTIETAVRATKLGAHDFIEKPLSLEKLLLTIHNGLQLARLIEENRELKSKVDGASDMIGTSPEIAALRQQIEIVAPTSGWALITGENGTGKELVARAIHRFSKRSGKPFVEVNCAAIPEDLIESELFGHEKGAFTGATAQRRGKFDQADEGTLFLDEIGDMSLKTQAKVLRILQEKKFERVGGQRTIEVDVRVIAATNKDLTALIREGQFREDLYYRLNVIPFHVPPLRARRDDIPLLANHFLHHFCTQEGREIKSFDQLALEQMCLYPWPGNVRELKNLVERLVILVPGRLISSAHLPFAASHLTELREQAADGQGGETADTLREAREEFEKEFLLRKLEENDWNVSRTAEAIDVERSNLHRKIKSYGIELKK